MTAIVLSPSFEMSEVEEEFNLHLPSGSHWDLNFR